MDNLVFYTLGIDIPFNETTTRGWSPDEFLCRTFIESGVNHIRRTIMGAGYISMGKVFRILGMKEQIDQPNIFFEKFDDYDIKKTEDGSLILSMYLTGGYEQNEVRPKQKKFKPYIVPKDAPKWEQTEAELDQMRKSKIGPNIPEEGNERLNGPKITEIDEKGRSIAGRYPFNQAPESEEGEKCLTGLKETSGSAENGKT